MPLSGVVAGYRDHGNRQYVGPGDIVSGATAWVGLRGYSAAVCNGTTNAVRLRRSSDNAEQDFVILSDGELDVASINTFKGAANLFVTTLYDQTGNGNDFTNTTAATQPALTLSGLGSLPIMGFTFASSQFLQSPITAGFTQPFSFSAVAQRTSSAQPTMAILVGGTAAGLFFGDSANGLYLYAGTQLLLAAPDNNWYGINSAANGVSSNHSANTTWVGATAGSNNISTVRLFLGTDASSEYLTGNITEAGFWSSLAFSAAQDENLCLNQRSYWGI
jgi:alpha-L-arabinofuranosidase B-like protein